MAKKKKKDMTIAQLKEYMYKGSGKDPAVNKLIEKLKKDGGQLWKDWQETRHPKIDHGKFKADFLSAVDNGYVKDFCKPGEEMSAPAASATVGDIPL